MAKRKTSPRGGRKTGSQAPLLAAVFREGSLLGLYGYQADALYDWLVGQGLSAADFPQALEDLGLHWYLPPGTRLDGGVEIRGLVRQGGMAAIYEASAPVQGLSPGPVGGTDHRETEALLVKAPLLRPDPCRPWTDEHLRKRAEDREQFLQRFRKERQTLHSLGHQCLPVIVRAGDLPAGSIHGGLPWFATRPYSSGALSLNDHLAKDPGDWQACPDKLLRFFDLLWSTLCVVHEMGLVHGDISGGNVLVSGGLPVLIDFGLAVRPGQDQSSEILGTPGYICPERQASAEGDAYSFGVLLAQALIREDPRNFTPHAPGDLENLCANIARCLPDALGKIPGSWLPNLTRLFSGLLAPDPEVRRQFLDSQHNSLGRDPVEGILRDVADCWRTAAPSRHLGHLPAPTAHFAPIGEFLDELEKGFEESPVQWIHGFGGLGKSEQARQFGTRFVKQALRHQPLVVCHWIDASDLIVFKNGLLDLHGRLVCEGRLSPRLQQRDDDARLRDLQDWLVKSQRQGTHWLLILDNLNDPKELLGEKAGLPYLPDLPAKSSGRLLITSQSPYPVPGLRRDFLDPCTPRPLPLPSREQARRLFCTTLGVTEKSLTQIESEALDTLVEHLGRVPLGLREAAGYIRENQQTIPSYLLKFEQAMSEGTDLQFLEDYSTLPKQATRGLVASFQLSFERLQKDNDAAWRLLTLCSLLNGQAIPLALLCGLTRDSIEDSSLDRELQETNGDDFKFRERLLNPLRRCSQVEFDPRAETISIHAMRQRAAAHFAGFGGNHQHRMAALRLLAQTLLACRPASGDETAAGPWLAQALHLAKLYLEADLNVLGKEEACYLNDAAVLFAFENEGFTREVFLQATEPFWAALVSRHPLNRELGIGRPKTLRSLWSIPAPERFFALLIVESMHRKALAIRTQVDVHDHPEVAQSHNNLGLALSQLGSWQEAEDNLRQALAICEKRQGRVDELEAICLSNLGRTLNLLERWPEAEGFLRKALNNCKQLYDPSNHAAVAENLAIALGNLGRWAEAEQPHTLALQIWLEVHGFYHPVVVTGFRHWGYLLGQMGRLRDAEQQHRIAVDICEKVYGPEHSEFVGCLLDLGNTLFAQERWSDAEPLFQGALEVAQRVLGPDHSDLLVILCSLGHVLARLQRWEESEARLLKALEIQTQMPDLDDWDLAWSLGNLGLAVFGQGRWQEAEELFRQALSKLQDRDDELKAMCLGNLGRTMDALGRWPEAEELHRRALVIFEQLYAPNHLEIAASAVNLAITLGNLGRWAEAEQLQARALAIQTQVDVHDHPEVAQSHNNLGLALSQLGRLQEAEQQFRKALDICERIYGPEHQEFAGCLNNLGLTLNMQGHSSESEPLLWQALKIREKLYGSNALEVAISLVNLGMILRNLGRCSEAVPLYQRALAIHVEIDGHLDPSVGQVAEILTRILDELGRAAEVEPLLWLGLEISESVFGTESLEVQSSLLKLSRHLVEHGQGGKARPLLRRLLQIRLGELSGPKVVAFGSNLTFVRLWLSCSFRRLRRGARRLVTFVKGT